MAEDTGDGDGAAGNQQACGAVAQEVAPVGIAEAVGCKFRCARVGHADGREI